MKPIFFIPYCNSQNLLSYSKRNKYYANNLGWRYDLFDFANVNIATGYSFPRKSIVANREIVKKYENKAIDVVSKRLQNKEEVLNDLIHDMINELIKNKEI